jgi:hypothetical protein
MTTGSTKDDGMEKPQASFITQDGAITVVPAQAGTQALHASS